MLNFFLLIAYRAPATAETLRLVVNEIYLEHISIMESPVCFRQLLVAQDDYLHGLRAGEHTK